MTTLTEINFDVDEYLSNGGRLRDLSLPSGAELKTIERLAKSGTFTAEIRDRIGRIGSFLERIAQLGEERVMTGERVTEETLQSIWRTTEPACSGRPVRNRFRRPDEAW
jgi:hypothetical protein